MKSPDKYLCHMVLGCLVLLLLTTGCDPVFKPLNESDDQVFAINGILDASADTQWVRIMPVRESVSLSSEPDPIPATVTLTHLASGQSAVMRDSIIYYRGHSENRGVWSHTFWTTMDLEPENTYRLEINDCISGT